MEGITSPAAGTLGSRTWVLQEDLLSPRTLHFTKEQLIWEYQFHKMYEAIAGPRSEGMGLQISQASSITKRFFLKHESMCLHPIWSQVDFNWSERWYNIVDNFTRRDITYHSDRLPAISATAREFHGQSGWTYLAGLWREDFRRGLLWADFTEASNSFAPSWSWASLEYSPATAYHGGVYYLWPIYDGSVRPDDHIELLDSHIDFQDGDPYGSVSSCCIILQGRWMPASRWKGCSTFHFNPQRWTDGKIHSDVALEHPLCDQIVCTLSTAFSPTELLRNDVASNRDSTLSLLQISSWDLTKEPWPNAAARGRSFRKTHGIEERESDEMNRTYTITFDLMLVPAKEPGMFRRVGLCEIPLVNGLADGWEIKEVSVV